MAETGTDIAKAAFLLKQGETVAIPTETVYGLAANALNPLAAAKIFEVKQRPFFDPLIVHIKGKEELTRYAEGIPEIAYRLADKFWPGPLTLVLPKKDVIPDIVTAGLSTAGFRVPAHPLTKELLSAIDFPLAAPSANPFGYISPTTARHVADQLADKIPYILDGGPCAVGLESTILGFEGEKVIMYRVGGTPIEEIVKIAGEIEYKLNQSSNPNAPGQLESHYAPRIPLVIGSIPELTKKHAGKRLAIISFTAKYNFQDVIAQWQLSQSGSLTEAACNLFAAMREADSSGADIIIAELVPETGTGAAINDRLRRAAVH